MKITNERQASVFGVVFSTGTMSDALNAIDAAVSDKSRRTFCAFVNADCLNQAYTNKDYAAALEKADHVWPDGAGVAIAAAHIGKPVSENVNGTDMFPLLCARGHSMFFLGGRPGVAEQARKNAEKLYPCVRIAGVRDGFFKAEETSEAIAEINAAHPDILLVAMGVPKQEFWIAEHLDKLDCRAAIGVGGLFDFVSGRIKRAPGWLRRLRLEWIYRLYNEPVRLFRRYIIGNPLFLWRVWFSGR